MRLFLFAATFWGLCLAPGLALQIQCYQCEEFQLNNDCSSPEFIVNCTVNVQDMCQKEVMEKSFGLYERYTNEFCDDTVPTAWCLKPPLRVSCCISPTVCFSKPSCGLTLSPTLAPNDLIKTLARIMYRKSCASSAACLIASAGYQSFCSPGKVNSVCISCCNTPLCNGPRPKRRGNSGVVLRARVIPTVLLLKFALLFLYC